MNFRNLFRTLVAACTFAAAAQTSATPVLHVTNGILTGADDVNVNGALYNVTFADGSCNSLFNGCSQSSFAFTTLDSAGAAARALLDQVFVDGPDGQFDSVTNKVVGCGVNALCRTSIPFNAYISNGANSAYPAGSPVFSHARAINYYHAGTDSVSYATIQASSDTSPTPENNFAIFTFVSPAASEVPEPSSIALIGIALAGFGFARRRKS